MICLLDYGAGNLRSVNNAIDYLGYECIISDSPSVISEASHLIIPGVGSYPAAMTKLRELGLISVIHDFSNSGRPLMGICLGMQILSEVGLEYGNTEGLGLIPGQVVPLPVTDLVLPHVGWNSLELHWNHPCFDRIKTGLDFYFVHSFCYQTSSDYALATTEYGVNFTSVVAKDNLLGVQFHPEKSQDAGLRLIENFLDWDGQC